MFEILPVKKEKMSTMVMVLKYFHKFFDPPPFHR